MNGRLSKTLISSAQLDQGVRFEKHRSHSALHASRNHTQKLELWQRAKPSGHHTAIGLSLRRHAAAYLCSCDRTRDGCAAQGDCTVSTGVNSRCRQSLVHMCNWHTAICFELTVKLYGTDRSRFHHRALVHTSADFAVQDGNINPLAPACGRTPTSGRAGRSPAQAN